MNLEQKNLAFVVIITIAAALSFPVLLPNWKLTVFAPLLIILFYKKNYLACLWWSLVCGAFMDLLASHTQFGLYAVNYCLTTLLIYGLRRNFFADSFSTLPIMTFFFAVCSTLFQGILIYTFEKENVFSWNWTITDLIYMPSLDALCAFCVFIFPSLLLGKRPRRGKDYFTERARF